MAAHGSPPLGAFRCEMHELLTSCLGLRAASLLRSGSLAGVLWAQPLGDDFPVPVTMEAAMGPNDPGCPLTSAKWSLHLFRQHSYYYLTGGYACLDCLGRNFCFVYCFFSAHKRHFCWRECRNTGRYREENKSGPNPITCKQLLLTFRPFSSYISMSCLPLSSLCFFPSLWLFFFSQHVKRITQNIDIILYFPPVNTVSGVGPIGPKSSSTQCVTSVFLSFLICERG